MLLAVNWIGNEATHGRGLSTDDVLMCAEVLEAALVSLHDRNDVELLALIRRINRQKGVGRRFNVTWRRLGLCSSVRPPTGKRSRQ
ncbi:hypothetical protein GCM10009758_15910 [Microbacterium hatanonis]